MPPDPPPTIARFELGPFLTNCYVVSVDKSCWIIDASFEPDPLIDHVHELGLNPQALILTHAHADHIAGVEQVMDILGDMPLLIHPAEESWLDDPAANLSASHGVPIRTRPATATLEDAQTLDLAHTTWRVLHVPGHSPGGIALYHEPQSGPPILIAGDALFSGSIGRTDFPTSNHEDLIAAIKAKLYTLPPETRVLPGHGPETTIGRERDTNPFVRGHPG